MTDTTTNRKPADRLADIREQIRTLKAEEESLRLGFIAGDLPLEGDDYTVVVETKINERIDLKMMKQHVAESVWSPYLISTPSNYVKTERKHVTQKSCAAKNEDYITRERSVVMTPHPIEGSQRMAHSFKK